MTALSLAVSNLLLQDPEVTKLVGKSETWPTGWIFDERPLGVAVEGKSRAMIVVNEFGPFTGANEHNTLRFPEITIDIWADPKRDADGAVAVYDAKRKIERLWLRVDRHLHLVDTGSPDGSVVVWGTAEEISTKTGVFVVGSSRLMGGPEYSPIKDTDGAFMGRIRYGVHLL